MERDRPEARGRLTLAAAVVEAARRYSDRPAVVAPDHWALSYIDLDRLSDEVAAGLVDHGVGAGDVVALLLPSSPDYLVAYVAAAKIGAVTAGVNPRLAPAQRALLVQRVNPEVTIATAALLEGTDGLGRVAEVPLARRADECLVVLRRRGEQPPHADPPPDHPVAVVFTSGTTGAPRGAVSTVAQLHAIADLDTAASAPAPGTPMLVSTELVHVGVMTKLPWYLAAGATLHLLRRWRAADALQVISRERIPSVGVMSGYWQDAPATAAALVDGWLRTDDLGRIDEAGCLRLAGRRGDSWSLPCRARHCTSSTAASCAA